MITFYCYNNKEMVKNDVSFILSFVILMENVDFWVLSWGVLDGTE